MAQGQFTAVAMTMEMNAAAFLTELRRRTPRAFAGRDPRAAAQRFLELHEATGVAGDYLVEEYGGRKARQRAEAELDLIKKLEDAPGDALAKCRALWVLITTGKKDAVSGLVEVPATKTQ